MKCIQCGTEFTGKFCPECGRKAEQTADAAQRDIEQQPARKKKEKKVKQKKKKPFFLRGWFIILVIIAAIVVAGKIKGGGEKIVWNDIILGDMLPEPDANKGEIHTNSPSGLWIDINDLTDKEFADYVEKCKAKGFTIDASEDSYSYKAYNAEGYEISLGHYGSDADMSIHVEAPMEMGSIVWPASKAGALLPTPKSTVGKFGYEYEDSFYVYVGNTSKADYAEYVAACSDMGFNVDYSKGEDYYFADNSEGWYLAVRYEGNNIMSVNIDAPDETAAEATPEATPETAPEVTPAATPEAVEEEEEANTSGISNEFKAAMDSYEEFMDEYVEFMKKFNVNPTDVSFLMDYADYMKKYAEFVEDFEAWQNKEMNTEEALYYLEVQTRVNKKLLEVLE